ncbi:MAG: alginate lyase family protein, partial [Phycisphaerae bacterium]
MQSLSWYYRRLRAMSMDEVLWRVKSSLGTTRDRYRLSSLMKRAAANAAYANEKLAQSRPEARITFPESLAHASTHPKFIADNLPERADRILAGQISLLGNIVVDCGPRIDWNYDYQNKIASPSGYSPKIDYRDVREAGDAKWVWEPSRHQHFVVLARQYALTGEREYLHTIVDHWTGWLDQCPFQVGMQWRSPLELGIRLINWSLTWELVDGARNFDSAFRARVLQAIDLHLYDITAKYSRGSSANNHLVGEAAGVLVAAAVFPAFPYTTERFETARSILEREIELQILPDGSNAEFTTGYHVFVLQFFTVAGLVARRAGRDFGAGYWERLKKGYAYLAALHEAGGPMPMFNDADDGFVVDLDHHPRDPKPWLTVGAVLFDSPAWLPEKIHGEAAYWLLGAQQTAAVLNKKPAHESRQLKSRAFSDAGHYLLQTGKTDEDNISVVFDCGPLGFGSIAAHGHADALSFTLRANGRELLTDPGTYDYFTHRAWRDHLRTTAAHNTVVVD